MRRAMYARELKETLGSWAALAKRFWYLIAGALVAYVFVSMAYDVEYASEDIQVRGLRVFDWLKAFVPGNYVRLDDKTVPKGQVLFPFGKASIRPEYIVQGAVYDCRFLSTLAAFASTERGRAVIAEMVADKPGGGYVVTFPGAPGEPVAVGPLTEIELKLYARARAEDRAQAGVWLPAIEKAYGQYRTTHQPPGKQAFRWLKHGVLEGRFTSSPQLAGFGASFGAADDQACTLLTGHEMKRLKTTSWEFGDFGLGKDYVSIRQMRSWLDRKGVTAEIYQEQDSALKSARQEGRIVMATTEISGAAVERGLRSSHAYAVIDYKPDERKLRIADPYGNGDFVDASDNQLRDWPDDGVFYVSLPEFNRYFSHLQVEDGRSANGQLVLGARNRSR